jgi:hypothetical protein
MKINLKTRFLLGVMMSMFAAANAQTEMGNFFYRRFQRHRILPVYSLKVEDSYSNDDAGKLSTFGFKSGAGYFIANNLVIGLTVFT